MAHGEDMAPWNLDDLPVWLSKSVLLLDRDRLRLRRETCAIQHALSSSPGQHILRDNFNCALSQLLSVVLAISSMPSRLPFEAIKILADKVTFPESVQVLHIVAYFMQLVSLQVHENTQTMAFIQLVRELHRFSADGGHAAI